MTKTQKHHLNFLEQIRLNKKSIYGGIDFKLSVLLSVISFVLLIIPPIYDLFDMDLFIVDLSTINLLAVYLSAIDLFIVSTLTPIISSLFPTFIGVLTTIVAFSFAGLIFFMSFHADDKSIPPLKRYSQFSRYLFIFHWLAFIGVCGIISCSVTIVCVGLNNGIILSPLFLISIFFISYTLFSVLSSFSTLSKFGQIRFQYCVENNNENKERQNASKSMPCSQSESTLATGASANNNFRTSKDNTSAMNLERHKLLRRT